MLHAPKASTVTALGSEYLQSIKVGFFSSQSYFFRKHKLATDTQGPLQLVRLPQAWNRHLIIHLQRSTKTIHVPSPLYLPATLPSRRTHHSPIPIRNPNVWFKKVYPGSCVCALSSGLKRKNTFYFPFFLPTICYLMYFSLIKGQ